MSNLVVNESTKELDKYHKVLMSYKKNIFELYTIFNNIFDS